MTPTIVARKAYQVPFSSFTPFLLISFALAWGILGLYIFLSERMEAVFGQLTGNHPLFFLAVYAPAIAAFALVASRGGLSGLRRFLARASMALQRSLVCLFNHWPSVDFHWRFRAQWEPLYGTDSVYFLSGCARGVSPCCDQRSDRGVRLAWSRTASSAKEVRADLGCVDSRCHMGAVAFPCLPLERNPAE